MKSLTRLCPQCGAGIHYKSYSGHWNANKKRSPCRRCSSLNSGFTQRFASPGCCAGKNNPFYGRRHSEEAKAKLREVDRSYAQTDEFRKKISEVTSGDKNPMSGRTVMEVWVEKHGPEEATRRENERKRKLSERNSGSGNPMYGKPSPQGAGNGWSGWYKDWYFRSLHELAYMIKVIEANGLEWRSAESREFRVEYTDHRGRSRSYHPDFLVSGRTLVECKPRKLWLSPTVRAKAKAARMKAASCGLDYELVDVGKPSDEEIRGLYESGQLRFLDRYDRAYQERIRRQDSLRDEGLCGLGQIDSCQETGRGEP